VAADTAASVTDIERLGIRQGRNSRSCAATWSCSATAPSSVAPRSAPGRVLASFEP